MNINKFLKILLHYKNMEDHNYCKILETSADSEEELDQMELLLENEYESSTTLTASNSDDDYDDNMAGSKIRVYRKKNQSSIKAMDMFQPYFTKLQPAIDLLVEEGLVVRSGACFKCNRNGMKLVSEELNGSQIIYNENAKLFYKCNKHGCQMKRSIFYGTILNGLRCSLPRVFQEIFLFLTNCKFSFKQEILGMAPNTVSRLNKLILEGVDEIYQRENPLPIGGKGKSVQIDETIVVKGMHIKCPSKIEDSKYKDGIWIVGGVEDDDPNRFFVVGVPNRTTETIKTVLEKYIADGSEIITDCHKSYPSALAKLSDLMNISHFAVNHSKGFTNSDGRHTNKIEALWSGMKKLIKIKSGLKPGEVDDFLVEFRFRRRYKEVSSLFIKIIEELFKK